MKDKKMLYLDHELWRLVSLHFHINHGITNQSEIINTILAEYVKKREGEFDKIREVISE